MDSKRERHVVVVWLYVEPGRKKYILGLYIDFAYILSLSISAMNTVSAETSYTIALL